MTLNIGIIGTGFIGRQHMEAISRIPEARVVALCDTNNAQETARCYGVARWYSDPARLIADPDVDVVHNCTPNNLHTTINHAILDAGKPFFCEKPLASTVGDARSILDRVYKTGSICGLNYNYRHYALVQQMRARIASGESGTPIMVRGHYLQDWLLEESDADWRVSSELGGASRAMADIGSHWCDIAQHVVASPIRRVMANLFTVYPKRGVNRDIPVENEDGGIVMLEFENGILGQCAVSQTSAGHKNDLCLIVDTRKESIAWRQERPDRLEIGRRGRPNEVWIAESSVMDARLANYTPLPAGHTSGWTDALKQSINAFYASVNEGRLSDTVASIGDGERLVRIVDAMLTSCRERRWVDVDG